MTRASGSARFPRAHRVRRRADFVAIQNHPEARARTRHLLVLAARREDSGPCRLGVVASRKVGPAVARNRAKRLVREAFRKLEERPAGVDVVVIVRAETATARADAIQAELARAFRSLPLAARARPSQAEPSRGPRGT